MLPRHEGAQPAVATCGLDPLIVRGLAPTGGAFPFGHESWEDAPEAVASHRRKLVVTR